ncbi:hypothetical protein [Ruegeria sp. ANG-R]|nr:hypothetical protein [Ruegeria sp. ANG-R]
MSEGGAMIFVERPIALAFLVIGVAATAFRIRGILRERRIVAGELEDA